MREKILLDEHKKGHQGKRRKNEWERDEFGHSKIQR